MFLDRLDQPEQDALSDSGKNASPQALPTMGDLDALTAELDVIDATLADLQD